MNTEHFYPELASAFPKAPWVVFDRALNTAARTLCRLGLVWRVELDPVQWLAGVSEYQLWTPPNTRVAQILSFGDLVAQTPQQLQARDPAWRDRWGRPAFYYSLPAEVVSVVVAPTPTTDGGGDVPVRAAIMPTVQCKDLDDGYAWDYERLLFQGAVANLGGASWGDFERACREARSFATDNNRVGTPRAVRYGGI